MVLSVLSSNQLLVLLRYIFIQHSYDPVQNIWRKLADMWEFRSSFSLVAHKEHLYAIGGDKEINTNVNSVEMYNPDTNSWR